MKLTPEQLRQTADAMDAFKAGKPVELQLEDGSWRLMVSGSPPSEWSFLHDRGYRPAPEPEPPKVEPWDMKTCPPLPFEVVSKSGDLRTVLNTATGGAAYLSYYGSIHWPNLLRDFTLPDGYPGGIVKEAK